MDAHTVSSGHEPAEFVTALARGLQVIAAFSHDAPEMTLSDVARAVGLTPATARRYLHTLEHLGYVRRVGKRFLLTPSVLTLGGTYAQTMNLREFVQPFLQQVVDAFGGSSSMTVLQGNDVMYMAHVAVAGASLPRHYVGARLPAHATSTGHVLLAHREPSDLQRYLDQAPFPRFTTATITSRADLGRALDRSRACGYSAVQDMIEYGTASVAVPIRDPQGSVFAAINTSGSTAANTAAEIAESRLATLLDAAHHIEAAIVRFPTLARSVI